jgi:hypothetical protein
VKVRVYEEVDVTEWLAGQVRAGCTQLNLLSHTFGADTRLCEWALSDVTDLTRLTDEVARAIASARARMSELVVFGLCSYRPERWAFVEMAVFVEEGRA